MKKRFAWNTRFAWLALLVASACGGTVPPAPATNAQTIALPAASAQAVAPVAPTPITQWSDAEAPIPVTDKDPVWGNRNAPVTLVLFSDFQCPFCQRVNVTYQRLKRDYGPEKLRIVWKNRPLPFHANAKPAAEAAQGVMVLGGSNAFWKFQESAFENNTELSEENFLTWARDAGVDPAKIHAGLGTHVWAAKVDEDDALAEKVGAQGTPTTFVNGQVLTGAQPLDKFKAAIDGALVEAARTASRGVPKDRIYVELAKLNFTAPKAPNDGEDPPQRADVGAEDQERWYVPISPSDPILGNNKALVTIVEFADFQCPFCQRVQATLDQVRAAYGDQVRVVWKHHPLPFHTRAEPAAELANEARAEKGNQAFWFVHRRLMASGAKLEDADLELIAKDHGLDLAKTRLALGSHKHKGKIDADTALAAKIGSSGTPDFYINGHHLTGAQPFDKFKAVIDAELARAQAIVGKGGGGTDPYAALIKGARTER